jgi:hypothetical protein
MICAKLVVFTAQEVYVCTLPLSLHGCTVYQKALYFTDWYYTERKSNNPASQLHFLYRYTFSLSINTKDRKKTNELGLTLIRIPLNTFHFSLHKPLPDSFLIIKVHELFHFTLNTYWLYRNVACSVFIKLEPIAKFY